MLLICAALAVAHVFVHLATVPVLTALAPFSPPAYALVAGIHSITPYLARRLTGVSGSALTTSALAAMIIVPTTSSGVITAVPVLLAGLLIDLVLWRARPGRGYERRSFVAAVVVGTALFAVSVAVFAPEHRVPIVLLATLAGRIGGEVIAVLLARILSDGLRSAGVGRGLGRPDRSAPDEPARDRPSSDQSNPTS